MKKVVIKKDDYKVSPGKLETYNIVEITENYFKLEKPKYTAVDFLVKKIVEDHNEEAFTLDEWKNIFDTAKQIEKNQIVSAFIDGDNYDCLKEEDSLLYALAYYSKKFNK